MVAPSRPGKCQKMAFCCLYNIPSYVTVQCAPGSSCQELKDISIYHSQNTICYKRVCNFSVFILFGWFCLQNPSAPNLEATWNRTLFQRNYLTHSQSSQFVIHIMQNYCNIFNTIQNLRDVIALYWQKGTVSVL